MKAVICERHGPPEALQLVDLDIAPPEPGEVQLRIEACGINFPDLLIIAGKYQEQPPLPFIPCGEVAGTIAAVGAGVDTFSVGDPVMAITYTGGLAEFVNAPVGQVYQRPADMPARVAAGFPGVFGTAFHALKQRAALQPGETLLVLGAAGGVGHAAVQLGAAMGARVIAAAGSERKLDSLHALGANETINYRTTELRQAVKALTDGRGADVIFDPVGGELSDQALRCINWNGRLLVVGFASGTIPRIPANLLLLKGFSVSGVFFSRFEQEQPELAQSNMAELTGLYQAGRIAPQVDRCHTLAQYADALRALNDRDVVGKVIVEI